jgi:signal peptidase I
MEPNQTESPLWMRLVFGRRLKVTLIRASILIVTATLVFKFVLVPIKISGYSMEPTYHDGRIDFVNRLAYAWSKPQRFDVVAMHAGGLLYLKRIVALPGERVTLHRERIYVNNKELEEPNIRTRIPKEREEYIQLKPNEYFYIGDNRRDTAMGAVSFSNIVGKVVF